VLDKFWETVGGRLTDRLTAGSVAALAFWLGGLLAWTQSRGGLESLREPTDWLRRQPPFSQAVVVVVLLLVVGASGMVVQRLAQPALRLLEGYWPSWLDPVRDRLVRRVGDRVAAEEAEWQQLAQTVLGCATPDPRKATTFRLLDHRRRRRPSSPDQLMPTRLGNILRAAESRPADKYGLDAVAVWPCLWLVLPDATRQELTAARAALSAAVAASVWGAFFLIFTPLSPLAAPIGLVIVLAALLVWVPSRAEVFGDLLEAAFDLHRFALYRQLQWPLPTDPQHEPADGARLTSYLWRGSHDSSPTFTPPG
jgi:hypothetical protein